MEKKCTICKETKKLSEFNKKKTSKDGHLNICRLCSNNLSKKYYIANKEEHIKKTKKRSRVVRDDNRILLFEYYKENPCVDCGESDPIVLELDHRDDVEKTANVSDIMGWSWETIKKEIDKCDVRCANCHRRRTAKQQNWYNRIL